MEAQKRGQPLAVIAAVRAAQWLAARAAAFATVSAVTTLVIFLRAGTVSVRGQFPEFHGDRYWAALKQFGGHLLHLSWGHIYEMPTGDGPPTPIPSGALIGPLVKMAMPQSLLIFGLALLLALVLGTAGGMLASRFSLRWLRPAAVGTNLALLSFPDTLMVILVQFGLLQLKQATGFELISPFASLENTISFQNTALPVLLLALFPAALIARLSVTAFDEIFVEDYIRTARSKGLSGRRITWTHALRNAIVQILGGLPTISGLMISNLIVIEYLMNGSGAGRLLAEQITQRYPSPNLIAAIAICFAAAFTLVDGLVDALLLWLDPLAQERYRTATRPQERSRRAFAGLSAVLRGAAAALFELLSAVMAWFDPRTAGERLRRMAGAYRGNPALTVGTLIVGALLLTALFAPQLAPADPNKLNAVVVIDKNWIMPPFPPGTEGFPLGSDHVGRDLLSRLLHGARYTLLIAAILVPLRILIALPLGMAAGWLRGRWERSIQRLATLFAAIPTLAVVGVLLPTIFAPPMAQTMGNLNPPPPPPVLAVLLLNASMLILLGWPRTAESIRLMTRELAERPFIEGARAVGAPTSRVLLRHIFPHLLPKLIVLAASEMAWVMMFLTQLGIFGVYLGGTYALEAVGQVPRLPDWSYMLARPVRYMWSNQWVIIFPGIAFFLAILGFNTLAEGLRKATQRKERAPGGEIERDLQESA